ncbi:MAG: DUF4406 domain-containing protein [Sphingobacteriales bacterium]|nr:DUF4406 domain-containing protein [Sphingobacteriales bacterium]
MNNTELIEKVAAVSCLIESAKKRRDKQIVYLSGKVTGLSTEMVTQKFAFHADLLRQKGYFVFNPPEWLDVDCDWVLAMRLCIAVLPVCDFIYLQPDWQDSKGALMEFDISQKLNIQLLTV